MRKLCVSQRELLDAEVIALDTLGEYYRWRAEVEGLLGRTITAPLRDIPEAGKELKRED